MAPKIASGSSRGRTLLAEAFDTSTVRSIFGKGRLRTCQQCPTGLSRRLKLTHRSLLVTLAFSGQDVSQWAKRKDLVLPRD
jgi:hypothetical protein